ncbi:batten's disease protein Cln3 [Pisolithus orientalis]|uniref:batten's disease protein Cln3 n=1 Tax=Pisolithus orientalis TaxID=936130 RepID=UPI0022256F81|nr:batten's disease protein Cln3 [Pisolithus orientalis]KAI6015043.1 batten's disease protein Cln3 [Pisolithus orientalis]
MHAISSTSAGEDALQLQDLTTRTTSTDLDTSNLESLRTGQTMALDIELPDSEGYPFGGISSSKQGERRLLFKLGLSFFLFGLINNVLYVIILSAALDLVPPSTPKGIIAFCNISPGLIANVGWSYILKGRIKYTRRIVGCSLLSFIGMLAVALHESLLSRLLGICLASFSSGLGSVTFVQLSTTYSPTAIGGHSIGYWSSGTGAAGLFGAFLWWELRGLGVETGIGISSVLPFVLPLTYFFLLPRPAAFLDPTTSAVYSALPSDDPDIPTADLSQMPPLLRHDSKSESAFLTAADKLRLLQPMLLEYMLPLFCVYLYEYTINQGIAPTLLYPVPSPERYGFLSKIIHSVRDYYPLWQLVYQITVFISRSTISLGIPPIPIRLLPLPAIVQLAILITLTYESAFGIFSGDHEGRSIALIFILVSIEGVCGGLAYVNVFYRINQERPDPLIAKNEELAKQAREFKIGSLAFSDGCGILLASLLAMPTEIELCKLQMARGKLLCKGL